MPERLDGQIGFEDIDDDYRAKAGRYSGGGYLMSRTASDELAEAYRTAAKNKARAIEEPDDRQKHVWTLSAAERAAVEYLGRNRRK